MKYEILLNILFELLAKRKLTAAYLAEKHNVSARTIYRYVEILALCVPVQIQRGRNGGIFISDAYKLPVGFMTEEEYESAIEALSAMYSQLPEERFLKAKRKLSAQAKSEMRDLTLSGTVNTILVDSGTWGDTRRFSEKLRLVEGSIRDCSVMEIDYSSRLGEKSHRKIEPHVLVFKQSIWYVYAFCRKQRAFRLFRLGRIESAVLSGEKFIRRPFRREDIPLNYWTGESASADVTLEVNEDAYADVRDWLGGENLRRTDGKWYADVRLPDDKVLIRKIAGFGDAVKVLAPEDVRRRVKETAQKIAALYE